MTCREAAWASTCWRVRVFEEIFGEGSPALSLARRMMEVRRCAFAFALIWEEYAPKREYATPYDSYLDVFSTHSGVSWRIVDNRAQYETFSAAVLGELNGAITAAGMNVTSMAKRLGMDYNTLRRYLSGEREIPVLVLYAAIDQLPIDEAELFRRARARFER